MRILLDENMPANVSYDFGEDHEIFSVRGKSLHKKTRRLAGFLYILKRLLFLFVFCFILFQLTGHYHGSNWNTRTV